MFTAFTAFAAFSAYFCMYAFRKAFAVGTFPGTMSVLGLVELDLKTVFVISQVLGYCVSKFLGIKIVSELTPTRRALAIVLCISFSEAALLLFAVAPPGVAAFAMFLNGLPLGMVWGLVFGFLEGRKTSDLLGAGLCVSFIVASGFVKTVGKWTLAWGVSEAWMPFFTGVLFFPPLVFATYLLSLVPPPTAEDEAARTKRTTMGPEARREFFVAFAPGICALVFVYVLLTALRDFRDNFAREIWDALGYQAAPAILTAAEIPVALFSLLVVALVFVIRDNQKALAAIHLAMLLGVVGAAGATLLWRAGLIGNAAWMIAIGTGLYVAYVPFNCVLFDRLIAATGRTATTGFLIYVADAFGYLGSVGLLLYKNLGQPRLPWVDFLVYATFATAAAGLVLFGLSALYFWRRTGPPA